MSDDLKRTPLYEAHGEVGARFVPFGGWEMPVQYSGVVDEHNTVRTAVGLFDVSHMGEITVRGSEALAFLQHITCNDVSKLVPGRAQYTAFINEKGGVVDDLIIYMLAEDDYFLCVNASNTDKDFQWIVDHNTFGVEVENVSSQYAQLAIQGPRAVEVVTEALALGDAELSDENCRYFSCRPLTPSAGTMAGKELLIARTGYTGEDGFEIFCQAADGPTLWRTMLEVGAAYGIKPIGLGARDTLRLEACLPLHGHELRDDISVLQSGLGWIVKFKKGDFIGRDVLAAEKEQGLQRKLIGLEVLERGIIREETKLFVPGGDEIGFVTSGTKTPTVDKAIGLGFADVAYTELGTELVAEVRGRRFKVKVIKTPFYKRG